MHACTIGSEECAVSGDSYEWIAQWHASEPHWGRRTWVADALPYPPVLGHDPKAKLGCKPEGRG